MSSLASVRRTFQKTARRGLIEPVEGLRRDDEVDALAGKPRRFRAAVHAVECGFVPVALLGKPTHRGVRLDRENGVSLREERIGGDARPRADVGDDPLGLQADLSPEELHDLLGITGAVASVALGAVGEAVPVVDRCLVAFERILHVAATSRPPSKSTAGPRRHLGSRTS
jgi:hypothetical protein